MVIDTTRTRLLPILMVVGILLMTGCGFMRGSMNIDYNDGQLNNGLKNLVQSGDSASLSDFTSWNWDEVHLFHEWADRQFIETTVGEPVIKSGVYDSKASLLVFENGGKPVKAIGVSGDYLRAADGRVTFGADVIVQPSGGGFLQLVTG